MQPLVIERAPIRTRRLRLEPLGPGHAEGLWAATAASLPELRRWLQWARDVNEAASRAFAERAPEDWACGRDFAFAVLAGSELTGTVALHAPRVESLGEIGYCTRTDLGGRGYATEATAAVVAFAFDRVGLYRLELRAGVDNVASQRVAEKVGFRREGTLRQGCPISPTEGYDCHLYGLLAGDARAAPAELDPGW